jgi:hypothetical protein
VSNRFAEKVLVGKQSEVKVQAPLPVQNHRAHLGRSRAVVVVPYETEVVSMVVDGILAGSVFSEDPGSDPNATYLAVVTLRSTQHQENAEKKPGAIVGGNLGDFGRGITRDVDVEQMVVARCLSSRAPASSDTSAMVTPVSSLGGTSPSQPVKYQRSQNSCFGRT